MEQKDTYAGKHSKEQVRRVGAQAHHPAHHRQMRRCVEELAKEDG